MYFHLFFCFFNNIKFFFYFFSRSYYSRINCQWFDCGWTPRLRLRIAYIYHPSPWVSEYWRFVPSEYRPVVSSAKLSYQSGRKPSAFKRTTALNCQNVETTSQVSLFSCIKLYEVLYYYPSVYLY